MSKPEEEIELSEEMEKEFAEMAQRKLEKYSVEIDNNQLDAKDANEE